MALGFPKRWRPHRSTVKVPACTRGGAVLCQISSSLRNLYRKRVNERVVPSRSRAVPIVPPVPVSQIHRGVPIRATRWGPTISTDGNSAKINWGILRLGDVN